MQISTSRRPTIYLYWVLCFTNLGHQARFSDGILYLTTDADTDAEMAIELTNVSSLSSSDFILLNKSQQIANKYILVVMSNSAIPGNYSVMAYIHSALLGLLSALGALGRVLIMSTQLNQIQDQYDYVKD